MISGPRDRTGSTTRPTTSAIGRVPGGFTILEVLLVLALIALLASVGYGVSVRMLGNQRTSVDQIFWSACQAARLDAVKNGREVVLSFDPKALAFVCNDGQGTPQSIPLVSPAQDQEVGFFPNDVTAAGQALVGGVLVDTHPLSGVTFFPDGTCSPFHVQFRSKSGAHSITIDPWTCAPALPPLPATGA